MVAVFLEYLPQIIGSFLAVSSAVVATLFHSVALRRFDRYANYAKTISKLEIVSLKNLDLLIHNTLIARTHIDLSNSQNQLYSLWDRLAMMDSHSFEVLLDDVYDLESKNALYGAHFICDRMNKYSTSLNEGFVSMQRTLIEKKVSLEDFRKGYSAFSIEIESKYVPGINVVRDKLLFCMAVVICSQKYLARKHTVWYFLFNRFQPPPISLNEIKAAELEFRGRSAPTT